MQKRDVSEADTVTVTNDMLSDICGYDKYLRSLLRDEVLKRDLVEGDEAKAASQNIKRLQRAATRKKVTNKNDEDAPIVAPVEDASCSIQAPCEHPSLDLPARILPPRPKSRTRRHPRSNLDSGNDNCRSGSISRRFKCHCDGGVPLPRSAAVGLPLVQPTFQPSSSTMIAFAPAVHILSSRQTSSALSVLPPSHLPDRRIGGRVA